MQIVTSNCFFVFFLEKNYLNKMRIFFHFSTMSVLQFSLNIQRSVTEQIQISSLISEIKLEKV